MYLGKTDIIDRNDWKQIYIELLMSQMQKLKGLSAASLRLKILNDNH